MKHYFVTFCLFSLCIVLINCNTIADVNIVITPKESIAGNNSSWSTFLKKFDESKQQQYGIKTTTNQPKKNSTLIDYIFDPSLYFKRNNITTNSILNRISSDFTRIVYSNANSISM